MALLSPAAIADPPVFERARAAARYDDVARKLVHRLKYGDRLELGRALGAMMVRSGELTRQNPGSVQIKTPRTVLGVRGTTFVVSVDE